MDGLHIEIAALVLAGQDLDLAPYREVEDFVSERLPEVPTAEVDRIALALWSVGNRAARRIGCQS